MDRPAVPHMTLDEFRAVGHRMVDWIAAYWENVETKPVLAQVKPGETAAKLPGSASDFFSHAVADHEGANPAWDAIFRDLDNVIVPGLTHWQSPNFFGYFPANISGPAVLGDLLAAGLGVQGMLWQTSPACTELETKVLDWLGEACGLPDEFLSTSKTGGGVIQGTASEAALVALVAARERAMTSARRADGTTGVHRGPAPAVTPHLTLYTSTQAHSSITKAAMIAGLARHPDDRTHVRVIDVDRECRMDVAALAEAIRADRAARRVPFFVCGTIGTTGTTAIDDIAGIAGAIGDDGSSATSGASDHENEGSLALPWLHVDAAHAGPLALCPEFRWMFDGLSRADSYCFNPHKWMLTNFDCNCFWTRDRRAIISALSVTPEYLRNAASDSGSVIDYRDWQIPLGRRFRSLKLWFVLRHYRLAGLQNYLREHVRLAEVFEELVRSDARFEVATARTMNLVCFRLRGSGLESDARNHALMNRLNASGELFLTHTQLPASISGESSGRVALRMAIGATQTQEIHVRSAWDLISTTARECVIDR